MEFMSLIIGFGGSNIASHPNALFRRIEIKMNLNIALSIPVGLVSVLAFAQPAAAETSTANFPINATISSTCSLSATGIDFGEVGTAGATTLQTDGTGSITVTCTTGGAYSIGLDDGLYNVAAQRNAQSASNTLAYDLYSDAARGTVWTSAAAPVTGTGNAAAQVITVYGRIAAGLPFAASNGAPYNDTVLVTLTY
jgi:spore coat protein U-like protein